MQAGAAGNDAPMRIVATAPPACVRDGSALGLAQQSDEAEFIAEGILGNGPVENWHLAGIGARPRINGRTSLEPPPDPLDLLDRAIDVAHPDVDVRAIRFFALRGPHQVQDHLVPQRICPIPIDPPDSVSVGYRNTRVASNGRLLAMRVICPG